MSRLSDERVRAMVAAATHPNADCTGVSAGWCPVCGDCNCGPRYEGDVSGERTLNDEGCPLHGRTSRHAEAGAEEVEALRDAAPDLAADLIDAHAALATERERVTDAEAEAIRWGDALVAIGEAVGLTGAGSAEIVAAVVALVTERDRAKSDLADNDLILEERERQLNEAVTAYPTLVDAVTAAVREEREAADALPNASLDNCAAAERAVADARAATDAALAAAGGGE